ncbi:MAG: HD domain-containing protein [Myxococcota bacterium]
MGMFSPTLERALAVAARAHDGQKRSGTEVPYFAHPVHVAMLLIKSGAPEPLVLAGVLHDVVEDTEVTLQELRAQFGDEVADLVAEVTQPAPGVATGSWREVRQNAIAHLERAPQRVAWLKSADTLHNVSALLMDVETRGHDALTRFKRAPSEQLWYYGEVARVCRERLGAEHSLAAELWDTMARLRERVGALGP